MKDREGVEVLQKYFMKYLHKYKVILSSLLASPTPKAVTRPAVGAPPTTVAATAAPLCQVWSEGGSELMTL